ncbi:MAG: hypothetical protein Q7J84_14795 [Sulfuricaulis sp.]|nr:hypothetical protein [Sulfuricaulis sp.]
MTMTAELAYQTVARFIDRERNMRDQVFRNNPKKLAIKITEADDALAALEILRNAATPATPTPHRQGGLF